MFRRLVVASCLLVLCLVASGEAALARAGDGDDSPVLTVSGEGTVSRVPDVVVIALGAEALEPTVRAAQDKVNTAVNLAVEKIEALGVERRAIQSTRLWFESRYEDYYPNNDVNQKPERRLLGYAARSMLRVRLEDLALAGKVIDAAIEAGVNDLNGIHFGLRDDSKEQQLALSRAVEQARAKAATMAGAMGVELIGVLEVSESYSGGGGQSPFQESSFAETRVEPGEVTVRANVYVRYRVGPRKP
jgi:uncharacterized protein YggE